MKRNIGVTDKIVRIILAVAIGYFAYSTTFETAWLQAGLYVVAAIMLLTSAFGICPFYGIFKNDTNEVKKQ